MKILETKMLETPWSGLIPECPVSDSDLALLIPSPSAARLIQSS